MIEVISLTEITSITSGPWPLLGATLTSSDDALLLDLWLFVDWWDAIFFLALVMSLVPTTKDPKKLPEKIAKKRAPASCATIRLLTFHYRKIFTRLLAQVGFGRAPTKIVTEATPGPKANIRCLTFHYRQIFKRPCGPIGA